MARKRHLGLTMTFYEDSHTIGWIGYEIQPGGEAQRTSEGFGEPLAAFLAISLWLAPWCELVLDEEDGPTVGFQTS